MANIEVRLVVLLFAVAVFVLWVVSIRRTRQLGRLVDEVRQQHPEAWSALPLMLRIYSHLGALRRLVADGVIDHEVYRARLDEFGASHTRHMILGGILLAAMALAVMISRWFGWVW